MFSRRLHLLILFFAAAWLPFSAVAAIAMPFCTHGQEPAPAHHGMPSGDAAAAQWAHGDCHARAADAAADPSAQGGLACDQCGFCHLACAGIIPPSAAASPVHRAGHVLAGLSVVHFSDHLPGSLRRPPRSA